MAVAAALFDYGNVLVRWDPRNLYRSLFSDAAEMEHFLTHICTPAWHLTLDAGAPFAASCAALAAQHPDYAGPIAAWDSRFGDMIDGEIAGSIALLDRLAARGVPLALLTNMSAEKQEVCFAPFSRLNLFDPVIVSGAERLAKPDPAIYALALSRMGRQAEDVFFTDDNAANIDAAAALGFTAHLFTTPARLEEALAEAGLLG